MERIRLSGVCDIVIGPGAADAALIPHRAERRKVAILAQPASAGLARQLARALTEVTAEVRVVPDREAAKTLDIARDAYEWLNESALTRHDTIVGVGGGALTDLAGFVAATYLRGVESIYVPTTLLGAVDASIGGKTGVNIGGKNLVGAFWHPTAVLIDTDVLEALPKELLREGAAEAIKAGFIGDPALVELYEEEGLEAPLDEVVARSVAVKVSVVEEDYTEQGQRAILNYGHTIGHAVEMSTGMTHGEAVAVGMVAAAVVSQELTGYESVEEHRELLASVGLPVHAAGADRDDVIRLLELDKKRDDQGLRMVVLRGAADPLVVPVEAATVRSALDAVGIG